MKEYLQMIKGLSNLDGSRSPHILFSIVFQTDIFYHSSYLEISGASVRYSTLFSVYYIFEVISQNS